MIPQSQISKTLNRYETRDKQRTRNIRLINEERFFDIDSPDRVKKFLEHRGFGTLDTNEIMMSDKPFPELVEKTTEKVFVKSLERIIGTNDLVDVSFLMKAIRISRSTGRIWINNSSGRVIGYGTGFLISPSLMMTNHHVLPDFNTASFAKIEFDYQFDINQVLQPSELYLLDPTSFYFSNEELDYAIVAVAPGSDNSKPLSGFGFNKLIKEEGKAIISQWLNIVEHPNGMPKQIGIRENQLIDVLDDFLQYKTDTAPGASGSPVYNERWEVVGLHHSGVYEKDASGNIVSTTGGVWNSSLGEDKIKWTMNEGVRISSILKHMEARQLTGSQAALFNQLFTVQPNTNMGNTNNNNEDIKANEMAINPDGSATWNIPLSVTVRIGGLNQVANNSQIAAPTVVDIPVSNLTDNNSEAAILQKAKQELMSRGDVLNVRMGYVFENGWITKKRAIVVSVPKRKTIGQLNREGVTVLPKIFLGYPVEVSGPTISDIIAFRKGTDTLEKLISPANILVNESLYVPPTDGELKKVTAVMKVNANVSPEKGWENLRIHLESTEKTLVVGMYDFGSTHIQRAIEKAASKNSFINMTMALQIGSSTGKGTKKDDLEDKVMVENLGTNLGNKFKNAWVKVGKVNGWVPSSYHIKVAVRDSTVVSVSSGSWQTSNQPNLENIENPTQASLLRNYNREWHVILENEAIAKAFEKFILNDYEFNKNTVLGSAEESLMEAMYFLIPDSELVMAMEANVQYETFEPFIRDRQFTVTPLLSPDNYFEETLALIKSAETELFIQNQTFNAPGENHDKLQELIDVVLQKQNEGVDVKIIFRNFIASTARENLEELVDIGFDPSRIKVHKKCHTKGVIVDGKKVMIGSQNWSNDGVSVNRDASLLFEDEELSQYFRTIFLHDWNKLAKQDIGNENLNIETIGVNELAPVGMTKVGWSDIQEML